MTAVVLASGSPRRHELLSRVGFDVRVVPPDVDETRLPGEQPVNYAIRLARVKVAAVPAASTVACVAADTIVHRGAEVWGKPADRDDAVQILRALSGASHEVTTAFAVRCGERVEARAVTTRVRFRALTDREIATYVASGEADDKAGAYGIQGAGGAFVAEVHGSWTNVMGLPVEEVLAVLASFGVRPEGQR